MLTKPTLLLSLAAASGLASSASGQCTQIPSNLCLPLDSSYTVVPITNGVAPCDRNDDGFTEVMLTGWSFDFFGTSYDRIFINNNGNVSFGQGFSAFTASGFPVNNFPMVAPFWGDVDTRNSSSPSTAGVVWMREWSTAFEDDVNRIAIVWDHVGYYNNQIDKVNTFQLILTDGNDPLLGIGNNVRFCYDDMQWTTGSASGGSGGFGGTPATVGINLGDGVTFFQVGRFDHPGTDYDGPGGNPDGVDFLDGTTFTFSTTSGASNQPPVFVNPVSSYVAPVGQPLAFTARAIGPEAMQTVDITVTAATLPSLMATLTSGNPAAAQIQFLPTAADLGTHLVRLEATDDGSPPETTTLDVTIEVTAAGADLVPPECIIAQQTFGTAAGEARDAAPGDSGIASVALEAGSDNLLLWVDAFNPGTPIVTWTIGRENSSLPGSGTIRVEDVAGNSSTCVIDLAPLGDCNANGTADADDIANGTSLDANSNGVPDECEQIGFPYCSPQPHNSSGLPATLYVSRLSGNIAPTPGDDVITLTAANLPADSLGFFAVATGSGFLSGQTTGLSSGNICLSQIGGFVTQLRRAGINTQGRQSFTAVTGLMSLPFPIDPGSTLYFQAWFRDPNGIVTNNLTDAVEVLFQ